MPDLPEFSDRFPLDPEAPRAFQRDGHVLIHALASPDEVAALRPGLLAAGEKARFDRRPLAERDTYGKAFIQMFNLWRHDPSARAFVFARRFAAVAAELMGVDGVRLYHDQGLFKEPGGGATPWHQDQFYWPLETTDTITLWMPLVPVTPEMGLMTFASASHRAGSLGEYAIGDESQAAFERVVAERGWTRTPTPALVPGDASFHAGWTLHSAPPNATETLREAMTIIYFADGTRVGPLDHANRRFDRDAWLRGCEPGEAAAGPLNPVLFGGRSGN